MDVGGWLRGLGLSQYEEQFRDNKIDADLLPRLTVDDLKDIGVSVVGDRRRLLDAIAVLAGAGPPADVPASPTKSAPSKGLQASAERRPITVMFCDLVGSTTLAAKLDAEDWRILVNAYLDEASAAVTGLDGHVLKKLGDGLMALFGYPHAQENDAERAVRAALAIQCALADLNARNTRSGAPALSARIGIECGSVVVDAAGEVFGEAPNVAARVQAAAEPGSVLITGSVQRQVAGLFVVEERGAHELKGVAQPLPLYRVVRPSGGGRRGGARALTQFVGREEDIGTLLRRWDRVRAGEGQFVQIVGEPGLGKSRLVEEFRSRLGETPHTWVEWNSSQLLQNTPLHPIAEWGRARFGGQDVAAERRLADLETTLAQVKLDVQETATLLAPLLDIPLPAERAPKFGPEEQRRRQLAAMVALLLAGARTQPVVLAFEDLHWADPTSLDLIQALAERGAQAPLLVVATTRPEFRAPWGMRSHHAVVALAPLDRTEVRRMVGDIAAQHVLPQEVVERVSERTGGVPLFVEEVTRLLVERGEQGGVQAIPPTLQQSLAARLDRLGSAREVAQVGAVLGRDFVYALLRQVAEIDEPALQASLDRLADADLLFVRGAPPEANYRFKHALIQDAAYESLLKTRRQALHRRAAEALREANAEPEVIAHHFTQAGLDDLAIGWWGKAGDQALRRSAFQEAIAHLGKAIAMADKGAEGQRAQGVSAAPNQRVTQLHVAQANALFAARGYGAPETTEAFARARESASGDKDAPERLAADYGLWVGSYVRGELPSMRAHSAAFLSDVEARPDSPEAGVAYRAAGITCWVAGEYREARDHLERALALFQPGRDNDLAFRFGLEPGVAAMFSLAAALWPLGEVNRAVSLVEQMLTRIADLTHVGTLAVGRTYATLFELMRGDRTRAAPNAFELVRLARENELTMYRAVGAFLGGWVTGVGGAPGGGLEDMRRGVRLLREQNVLMYDGLLKIALAEAEARAGDPDRAIAIIDETLATADRIGYRSFEAELHRTRGDILLKRDPANPAPAEEAFLTAITIAKQQTTRSFELRAALALAKLYQSTARPVEAHAVLATALEGFAPTPEMPEIAEAQALLTVLAATDEVKAGAARRHQLTQLHVSYGNALIAARGFAAPETTEAFARARESASSDEDAPGRLAADYGSWVGSYVRFELPSMKIHATAFLRDVASRPDSPEAGVAHRAAGVTCWFAGEYVEARDHFERALSLFQPGRDDDLAFRFGQDAGVAEMLFLAIASWPLGNVRRAISLVDDAHERIASVAHVQTHAYAKYHAAWFELMRGDRARAAQNASEVARLAREHDLPDWQAVGTFLEGLATAERGALSEGLSDMRRSAELLRQQNRLFFDGLLKIALADAKARAGDSDRALAVLDEALATSDRTGFRAFDAELHRTRGEILLKRDPTNPAPGEEALRVAIAIAKQQGTRSFELRAALSLAKMYQSTDRLADAHAVLAPALDGFAPTPEMPEIAEAQTLLTRPLAATGEVKVEAAQRQRLMQLRVAYGNALFATRGYGAPETTEAFARAHGSSHGDKDAPERLAADYGLWAGTYARSELPSMRAHASAFLRDVEARPDSPEAGVAHRTFGVTCWFAGEYREAKDHLERALALFQPGRDDDLAFRFATDAGVTAMAYLTLVLWPVGEIDRAISLIDRMQMRIADLTHVSTLATGSMFAAVFALMRGDHACAVPHAVEVARLARQHELPMYRAVGSFLEVGLALRAA
jgi:class 3 adenylate cyclase/tetratricopeptide (TPR) repeat protein